MLVRCAGALRGLNSPPASCSATADAFPVIPIHPPSQILADSDNSDDVKWSVYEPGESHGLYTNASFSALSGALAPGGREVVYIDVNVTGKEAKDREEIFIRIAIDDDPFHLELSLNLLVSSEPDVENCKLYVTNSNPDEGVGKAYAYAGEHTQLGVRAFDVDGFASTVSDVFFQCFLRDLSPSSDGSTDGTDGNFYHPKYSGDNTFVHDANPYMAGFWELNCKLDDADVRHAVNLTVLPGSPRTTDTRGEDLLSRKRANDTFAICYPDMACGEAMTAGGSPVLMRVELRDIYDNSVKALDGWGDLYFKTWGHLLAKNDDIISSDFHFELTDNRKGYAEANLSFTIAGNYRLEVFTGGTLIDETTLIVNAAEMTSVELFLIKFETEEYNATEILLLINRGPDEFGDALACAWKGCLEAKAGETIVGFVYGHDDYDNIVLPQRQGQVAHYRFVQGEDSAPFADFDGADAAYSLSGALLSVHLVESPTLLSTEIISTFVFVYNVMTLPPYDGDIYVRPLLYVGDRVDATASEAFQASTKEIGDFALIPGDLNFTQSVLFIFYPDTRQIISCARDSDTACADVRMGTDFVVGLSGKDNYGNKLVEMGDERVQLRLDDPITGSEEWTINADFQDDFEIFGSLVDDGMIIEYCQGTGRCTTGGTATTLQLRLIDERRRDADYASRASWEGNLTVNIIAGEASAADTRLYPADSSAAVAGSECKNGMSCGEDIAADKMTYFLAELVDEWGNPLNSNENGLLVSATVVIDGQEETAPITDRGDGTFLFAGTIKIAGQHDVRVFVDNEEPETSPFKVQIVAGSLQPSASVVRAFRHDSGAEFAKECATRVSCITVAAGELVQFQVLAYDEYQNRRYQNPSDSTGGCSFRVGGASTDELSVARFDADDGAYVFNASLTAVPAGAGLTYVDVWFGAVADSTNGTVGGGSFALTVTAAEASAERSYITLLWEVDSSVCPLASDRACVTVDAASDVNFQVHLVDAFRNELTRATSLPVTYSLGDDASRIEVPSVSGRYSIVVRGAALEVAGEYSIGVYLDGNALAAGPVRIDVVPGDADAGKTQLKRDDELCPSRKQCGSDVVADESILFTAVARDAFGNERDASSGVMELRVPDQAPTVLTDMGDGSYRGTLALRRANVYTIDAVLNSEPLFNSPFDLAIIAAPLAALNSSVRILVEDGEFPDCADAAALTLGACVTAAAGKWLRLEVVPRDKFLNTAVIENGVTCSVTHTFDEAAGALGPPALDPEPSACEVSQGVLGFNARLRAAGELGFGVMLNGVAVGNAMVRVDVQPTALDLATTEVIRLGARDGDIECFSGRKSACGPLVPPGNAISLRVRLRDALGNQLSRTAVGDFDVSLGGGNVSETTFRVDVTDLSAGVFEVEAVSSLVGAYEVAVIVEGDIAATLVLEWQSKPVSAYGELTLSAPEDSDPNSKEARQALRKAIAESLGVSIEWIQIDAVFEAGAGPAAAEDTAASQRRHLARALQQVGGAYNVEYTITSPDRGDTEEVLAAAAKIEELVPEDITAALASVAPELSFEVATLASLGADEFEEPELSPADSPLHTGQEECEDDKSCPISSEVMLAGTAQNYTVTLVDEFQNIMGFAPKSVGCAIEVTDQLGEIAADAITSAFEPRVLARGVCIVNARPVRTGRYFMRVFLGSVDEANAVAAMQRGVKFVVEAAASSSVQVSKFAFDDGTVVSAGEPFTVTIHSRDEFGNLRAYNDDNFTVTATPQPGTALRPVGQASWAPLKAGSSHLGEGKHAAVIADTSQAAQYCVSVTLGNASIGFQGGAESNACFQVQPAALSPPNTTVVHVVDPSSALQETRPGLPYEIIGDAEYLLTVEARDRFGNIRATSEDTFKVRARDVSGEAITGLLYETNTVARVTAHRVSFFAVREQASRAQVNITAENIGDAKASVHISGSPFTAQVFCPAGYLPFSIAGEVPGCVECDEELVECHGGTGAPFSIPQGLYLPPVASRCVGGGCILSSVYECKQEAACTTDDENTTRLFENWATIDVEQASLCAEGYDPAVVLCDSCLPGWTLNDAGDGCEQCPPGDGETYLRFFGLVGVLLLLCFLVFVVLYRSLQKDGVSMRDAAGRGLAFLHENLEFLRDDLEDTAENVGAVWQIVLQNCQVLGQLWKQMSSRFPNFLEKLYAPLLVLDVNPFSVMKVGCLASGFSQGYWDNVLFKGSIPFMVAFVAGFVAYRKLRQIVHGAQTGMPKEEVEGIRTTMATALVFAIFFLNLLHPSISSTMFETFNCKSYDLYKSSGEAWLQSDSSVQCYTDQWLPYAIFSGVVIILYVFGYPLILFVGLRYLHKRQKVVPCDADGVPIPGAPAFYTRKLQPRKPEPQDASEAKPDLVSPNTREAVLAQAAAAGRREAAGSSGALAWPGPGPQPGGIKLVRILSAPMRSFLGGRRGEGEEVVKALVPPHTLPPLSMEREHDGAGDVDGDSDSDGSGASSEEEEEYEWWAPDPHNKLNRTVYSGAESFVKHVRSALEDEDAKAKAARRARRMSRKHDTLLTDGKGFIRVARVMRTIKGNFGSQIEVPVTQLNNDEVFKQFVHPFVVQYQEDYYYWQVYEIGRRLMQTSFVVLVEIASPDYVAMYALFVSILGLCIQLYYLPYAEDDDDTLEVAFQLNLFITLFGIVSQENIGHEWAGSWQEAVIMACSTLLGCYVIYRLYRIMREWAGIVLGASREMCGIMCRSCWSWCIPALGRKAPSETGSDSTPEAGRAAESADGSGKGAEADAVATS